MRAPAFQFYPKQWLGDDKVMAMSWEARGMHMHLMCIAWQQDPPCTLPDDDALLCRWLSNPRKWSDLKGQIFTAWKLIEGRWQQGGLLAEFDKQTSYRESRKNGADKRWSKDARAVHMHSTCIPNASANSCINDALQSSTSSSTENNLKPTASQFELPAWISQQTWLDFEEMRKKIRKPLTDRARRNIVLELDRMRLQGQDSEAVLSQSITNSWSGVFELKGGASGKTGIGNSAPSVTKQRVDRNLAAIDKALERRGLSATDFDRQADGAELPGTGLERVLGGLPVGLRAVMPAVQHDPRDVGAGRVENPAGPEILPPAA